MHLPYVLMPQQEHPVPLDAAYVPLNDRSFLFGDSLYEVMTTYQGKPFFVDDHLERLFNSAAGVYMDLPLDRQGFKDLIYKGLNFYKGPDEVYIRLMISRGVSDFNIDTRSNTEPARVYVLFKTAPRYGGRYAETGFHLAVPSTRRNAPLSLNPAYKTGNYLNNVLCLHEAKALGADDALILDLNDYVTEASTSNFFIIKNGVLMTAPVELGVLGGITRQHLIEVARNLGMPVAETAFTLEDVYASEERFVSSSLKGAMPVYRVNDHQFTPGYGPLTHRLNTAYWEHVARHVQSGDYPSKPSHLFRLGA